MRQVVSKRLEKIMNEVSDFISLLNRIQITSFRNAEKLCRNSNVMQYIQKDSSKRPITPCLSLSMLKKDPLYINIYEGFRTKT